MLYHLVLAFAVISALQNIEIYPYRPTRLVERMNFGLILLIIAQGILFLLSAFAWQGLSDPRLVLPPVDRAITVFTLVWVVWLWLTPSRSPLADLLAGLSSVVIAVATFFSLSQWGAVAATTSFNQTPLNIAWELFAQAIVLTGIALLVLRRPTGWGGAIAFFTIQFIGHVVQLSWPIASSDFAGAVRLAQVCSFPLLPLLVSRLPISHETSSARPLGETGHISEAYQDHIRQKTDPRVVTAWVDLAARTSPEKTGPTLSRAIAHTMLAELCYLVTPTSTGELVLHSGFDLIRAEDAPGSTIPAGQTPALMAAITKNRPLRLGIETTSPDLMGVGRALNLNPVGCMLFIPLNQSGKSWGGILLLTPYSNREWSADEQTYLMTEAPALLQILHSANSQPAISDDLEKKQHEIEQLKAEISQIKQEYQLVLTALDDLRQGAAEASEVEALLSLQKEQQQLINNLQNENQRLSSSLAEKQTTQISNRLESELQQALREIAELESRLEEANRKLAETQKFQSTTGLTADEEREIVASVVQELRQPMASIIGYTDLLLTESAGILGPLQRKFLERVKASNEKLRSLLDDLVHVMSLRGGPFEMIAESVQISEVLDKAITDTSAQLREKNISLQIDLPDEMPEIHADRDGLHQIFVHLLQNAGTVTPNEGIISLSASTRESPGNLTSILMQVTDGGSGIQPEDLPQVFSRRYRTSDVLLQGVGDTGVGLSIVKALVEAHGGRIWVESSDQGSTFFVELPMQTIPRGDN
jgi:signal transduction histidine kinase